MATETVQSPPETLQSALARADAADRRGNRREAIRLLQTEIPGKFAGDVQAFVQGGNRLAQMQCFDAAEDLLSRGVAAMPENPWIAHSHARAARLRSDNALAIERFVALLEKFPDFDIGHADFIGTLINLGRLEEAEATAAKALEALPASIWIAAAHARVAETRGDAASALARWAVIRATWPQQPLGTAGELRAYARLGRFAEADRLAATAGDLPVDPLVWAEAAELAGRAEAWSFAAAFWERFRVARPDDEKGYGHGARALLLSGDARAAQRLLDQAAERFAGSAALAEVQAELTKAAAPAPAKLAAPAKAPTSAAAKKPAPARSGGVFGWLGW